MIATGPGLTCPRCGGTETEVKDSRPGPGFIRRRRKCLVCTEWNRFTTAEVVVSQALDTMTPDPFHRAIQLSKTVDALPTHKRDLILSLVAAFADDEVKL